MTEQEAFNIALAALRKQGCRGYNKHRSMCMYITPDGKRCAVGHLLSDGELQSIISPGLEVDEIGHESMPSLRGLSLSFLCDLQEAHDNSEDWADFEPNMQKLAEKYGLEYARG
jgi:hypothetical protein